MKSFFRAILIRILAAIALSGILPVMGYVYVHIESKISTEFRLLSWLAPKALFSQTYHYGIPLILALIILGYISGMITSFLIRKYFISIPTSQVLMYTPPKNIYNIKIDKFILHVNAWLPATASVDPILYCPKCETQLIQKPSLLPGIKFKCVKCKTGYRSFRNPRVMAYEAKVIAEGELRNPTQEN